MLHGILWYPAPLASQDSVHVPAWRLQLATYYLLPTTCCLLLAAYYLPLATHRLLLTYLSLATHRLPLTACHLLLTAAVRQRHPRDLVLVDDGDVRRQERH